MITRINRMGASLALAAAVGLGGCASDSPTPPTTETISSPAPAPEPAPATVETARAPEQPVPDLNTLRGQNDADITLLLGPPQFQRSDSPAELWQYRSNGCILDLFLYPSSTGGLSVDHLETRSDKPEMADPQACFAEVLRIARGT